MVRQASSRKPIRWPMPISVLIALSPSSDGAHSPRHCRHAANRLLRQLDDSQAMQDRRFLRPEALEELSRPRDIVQRLFFLCRLAEADAPAFHFADQLFPQLILVLPGLLTQHHDYGENRIDPEGVAGERRDDVA